MKDWCLEVWGDYACFTRPELKAERVSYDVMTPSAARGIVEAILWKPEIEWHITRIDVLNPIKWITIRRNEVGKKAASPTKKQISGEEAGSVGLFIENERQQRAGLLLKDVRYRIFARFELKKKEDNELNDQILSDNQAKELEAKYAAMFERRALKGQCFHRPYLGCREFACMFKLVEKPELEELKPIADTRELGYMLYGLNFEDEQKPKPMFFRAKLENGVLIADKNKVVMVS